MPAYLGRDIVSRRSHPMATCCFCNEQENIRFEMLAYYSPTNLQTEIPITLVPGLDKG